MGAYRKHPILFWVGGFFATLIVAVFIASFFLDDIVRARTETAMNQKLKGYHVSLAHAHLQLLGGILTLKELKVIQQAHPRPAVADIASMRFTIQVKELFSRRVVADVLLTRPKIHIDETQFVAEKKSSVSLRQKGWQDALEAAYPIKINRFTIYEGDVVYIQDAVNPPLHLGKLNFTTDNIRNIHAPNNVYPSKLHANLEIFGTGIRGAQSVTASVAGQTVPVLSSSGQGVFIGLDQVNIGPLPLSLKGSGQTNIVLTADGQAANTVNVVIQ